MSYVFRPFSTVTSKSVNLNPWQSTSSLTHLHICLFTVYSNYSMHVCGHLANAHSVHNITLRHHTSPVSPFAHWTFPAHQSSGIDFGMVNNLRRVKHNISVSIIHLCKCVRLWYIQPHSIALLQCIPCVDVYNNTTPCDHDFLCLFTLF